MDDRERNISWASGFGQGKAGSSAADDVFAVGRDHAAAEAAILHYIGLSWLPVRSPTTEGSSIDALQGSAVCPWKG